MEAEHAQALLLVDAELRRVGGAADVVVAASRWGDAGGVAALARSAGDVAGHGVLMVSSKGPPYTRDNKIMIGGVVMNVLIAVRVPPEMCVFDDSEPAQYYLLLQWAHVSETLAVLRRKPLDQV